MMQTKPMLHSTIHQTPVGALTLVASDQGLRAILWPKLSPARAGIHPIPRRTPDQPTLTETAAQLDEYFAGSRTTFDIPLDLHGTRFQLAAWRPLARIPFGTTTSYRRQADALGLPEAPRAPGAANAPNPVCLVLPCHRVLGPDGSLTGFGGGLPTKQWLLAHEARVLASSIVSSPEWQSEQPIQTRLSMPVA